ncbi:MAG TPA: 2-oxoacid:acceptor oxidoreductase subunit alpha [Syntrophales bacterium]|nr:2-oxoacid:acceptor oxidoreductase subunit alpha [Syntrophales bacterium]HNS53279.1 2-oxoacid:acceptor oxidoreductase subunit alpha [Syntrophales bacterium]
MMEFSVLIGGEAGQGMFSVELELSEMLCRLGYPFFATKNYMSRIRGGHNYHMIRVSDRPVHALSGKPWDMIVAMDSAETERRHRPSLASDGVFLGSDRVGQIEAEAREAFQDVTATSTILAGLILACIGADPSAHRTIAPDESVGRALAKGGEFAARWGLTGRRVISPRPGDRCKLDGNQALALGALMGGCQFVAGYPMTPATSILHYIASVASEIPVHFEQAEDEIAALNMALGASYAGLRSMVATSGGGFALMTEAVSLAGMTETPVVVIDAQRPGPATGLPTRTEQGDLEFVLHAGHGEFPRVIFAPGSIEEAISLARRAFDVADRWQIPVFILTDQYLADSVQIMEGRVPTKMLRREYPVFEAGYRRYALTDTGVSPLTYPGLSEARVEVDSDEHTEDGKITEDLDLRVRMVDKRLRKLEGLRKEAVMPSRSGDRRAPTVLVSWGSNRQIVDEAVEALRAEGIAVSSAHFGQVYPLTPQMARGLSRKRLICIENNATGQFGRLLRRELGLKAAHQVLKYNGECFTVAELVERVKKVLG